MENVNPIPQGFHTITPYLIVSDASRLIDFIKKSFNATEIDRFETDNTILHAILQIGDSKIMISDSNQNMKPMPCFLYLYVDNVDETFQRAIAAGAISMREPTDEFYGDRGAGVLDFAGNNWYIATHKKDVSRDELKRLAEEQIKKISKEN
jgi:PhnB protein